MSGTVADRKRLLRVTAGNLRQSHIYINGHFDFFPCDCVGPSRRDANRTNSTIQIYLEGVGETIETDIGCDARTGKPRSFFRGRQWVRRFFEHHEIKHGDVLAIERIDARKYRLYPFESKTHRDADWHKILDEPLRGRRPTYLNSGCGGMAIGFKRAGFRTLLAIEWDAAA